MLTASSGTTVVQAASAPVATVLAGHRGLRFVDRVRHLTLRSARITNVSVNFRRLLVSVVGLGHANGKSVGFTLTLQGRPAAGGISL